MSTEFESLKIRLNKFTGIMGILLFLMPLVLILIDGGVRSSISNYAYMTHPEYFYSLLSIAGAVFIMDGSIWNKRWYNIILGCSLIGIALTPHLALPNLHYFFSGIFFAGSVFTMIYYSSPLQRGIKIFFGGFVALVMLLNLIIPTFSLFWAEWLGIIPITIHFLGEAFNKLD